MSDPFLAEIRIFPFPYAPYGWAMCSGQIMAISQNSALFALVGVTYGGNGTSNFGLPNLGGIAPMQMGQGAGLSDYSWGETGGVSQVTLLQSNLPSHNHALAADASTTNGTSPDPSGQLYMRGSTTQPGTEYSFPFTTDTSKQTSFGPTAIGPSGGSQSHNNMMPYLTLNFCIALQGEFPPRG